MAQEREALEQARARLEAESEAKLKKRLSDLKRPRGAPRQATAQHRSATTDPVSPFGNSGCKALFCNQFSCPPLPLINQRGLQQITQNNSQTLFVRSFLILGYYHIFFIPAFQLFIKCAKEAPPQWHCIVLYPTIATSLPTPPPPPPAALCRGQHQSQDGHRQQMEEQYRSMCGLLDARPGGAGSMVAPSLGRLLPGTTAAGSHPICQRMTDGPMQWLFVPAFEDFLVFEKNRKVKYISPSIQATVWDQRKQADAELADGQRRSDLVQEEARRRQRIQEQAAEEWSPGRAVTPPSVFRIKHFLMVEGMSLGYALTLAFLFGTTKWLFWNKPATLSKCGLWINCGRGRGRRIKCGPPLLQIVQMPYYDSNKTPF